ncbi:AAA family ATPase [Thalassobellus suaedae]|uniref:ATP-binding protein n=1 Tax=Thalassobellus suaedae TaxID=3074124 RepID=A0ABY9XVV7_9FLAO|nr:ATP-binding protein [Flavobacteriaceae bacterium HL-DH14]
MNSKKIVITGGPGTGKTSIINELKNQNYHCFDEIIRELTLEAKNDVEADSQISNPIAFVNDPLDFNTKLLNGRLNQFKQAAGLNESLVFFDRGIPDVLAYMTFFNQEYDDEFLKICDTNRYHHIFLLPPWEAIYKSDNERFETFEEAVKIHEALKHVYKNLAYNIIEVPFGTIEKRIDFIINYL